MPRFVVHLIVWLFNPFLVYSYRLKFVPEELENPELQVSLPQGKVQGKINHTRGQKVPYYSFEGIPYATPPIGDLRFKAPEPAQEWKGTLNSTSMHVPSCIQVIPSIFNGFEESEDCLYINVFTPIRKLVNASESSLLPVMVWIYGGAFILGSANASYFGPDNLLEENVLVAHFGYRLASFGFLSTEDMESPGNYGLKDQHLALKWVKNNIKYFGGDPAKITIFGESAGAASVQYQLMYAPNHGLFQGAISESGSALCTWAYQRRPRKVAMDLGKAAGIHTRSTKILVEYLRNITAEELKKATMKASLKNTFKIMSGIPFAPVIEPDHPEGFLTRKAHQSLLEGRFVRVPYIVGFNSDEAGIARPALDMANPLLKIYDIDLNMWVPRGMNVADNKISEVGAKIRSFYFNMPKLRSDQYIEYVNDGYFFRPIIESAQLFGRFAPTFLYDFAYEGLLGRKSMGSSNINDYKGVMHTEEMAYLWSTHYLPEPNDTDRTIRERLTRLWTNFAKSGNPTPEKDSLFNNILWLPVGNSTTYLEIDKGLSLKQGFKNESMTFWKQLFEKYGTPPYDTY